jgi:proteasome accessory factor A
VQWEFHELVHKYLGNSSAETNWLLETWGFVLEALERNHESLIGGVDWITKKWLLETFIELEGLSWNDPWLQSIDLEYHNIDPIRGLFFAIKPGKRIAEWNNSVRRNAMRVPPANTRASGRARAVAFFQSCDLPYVINWDSIACDSRDFLVMGDPFQTYNEEVERFSVKPRPSSQSETET